MPARFEIVIGDITKLDVDAIVNAANTRTHAMPKSSRMLIGSLIRFRFVCIEGISIPYANERSTLQIQLVCGYIKSQRQPRRCFEFRWLAMFLFRCSPQQIGPIHRRARWILHQSVDSQLSLRYALEGTCMNGCLGVGRDNRAWSSGRLESKEHRRLNSLASLDPLR